MQLTLTDYEGRTCSPESLLPRAKAREQMQKNKEKIRAEKKEAKRVQREAAGEGRE